MSGVTPVTVVEDTPYCIAYNLAAGTSDKYPIGEDDESTTLGNQRGITGSRLWRVAYGELHTNARLYLASYEAAHAFSAFWSTAYWSFLGWYVDLQAPLTHSPSGDAIGSCGV